VELAQGWSVEVFDVTVTMFGMLYVVLVVVGMLVTVAIFIVVFVLMSMTMVLFVLVVVTLSALLFHASVFVGGISGVASVMVM
jgi:hypothetical protein